MGNVAEATYDRVNDYTSVKISLARPQDIRSWSFGEVKKPETINYRTYRPEKDGLFCERIFGPEKDWECACGKYRGMKYKGMICDRCGVKVTHSRVRRKRMGHIELAAPVAHIWFFKAMPSRLGNLLEMKTTSLEKVIYFQDYVVVNPGTTELEAQQLLTEDEYRAARAQYGDGFEADMGAEAVRKLLQNLDLIKLSEELRNELHETSSKQRKKELINRLKLVESIRDSENRPEWMILDVIPVIPPDLRWFCSIVEISRLRISMTCTVGSSTETIDCANWSTSTHLKSSSATKNGCCNSPSMHCLTMVDASVLS
jgi:DNA-directed RNA polymerase subunit beta'